MPDSQISFDDGAVYEEFMGVWSRLAGDVFLRWLARRRQFPAKCAAAEGRQRDRLPSDRGQPADAASSMADTFDTRFAGNPLFCACSRTEFSLSAM